MFLEEAVLTVPEPFTQTVLSELKHHPGREVAFLVCWSPYSDGTRNIEQ